jgi:hypothetical protein
MKIVSMLYMTKTAPSKNFVSIRVSGGGTNVWAYAISADTYARIVNNSVDDETVDVIMGEYQAGQLVCWGIDASSDCSVTLDVAGNSTTLKIIGFCDEQSLSDVLKECNLPSSTPSFGYNSDEQERLGENFDLRKLNHVFLDAITWKDVTLELKLPVDACKFDQRKLSLLVCDMDVETELSELAYENGLLDGLEEDIIGVLYDGNKYFFESECVRSIHQRRCMVSRTDNGWEIDENIAL